MYTGCIFKGYGIERAGKLVIQRDFINLLAEEKDNVTSKDMVYNRPKGIFPFALEPTKNTLNAPESGGGTTTKKW